MKKTLLVKDLMNELEREVEVGKRVEEQMKKKIDQPTPLNFTPGSVVLGNDLQAWNQQQQLQQMYQDPQRWAQQQAQQWASSSVMITTGPW